MEKATLVSNTAPWLPEDNILLKKAIEDGASLEALAKGAVHFSHAFTLQEVHDQWHALLYNPDVSAQACAHLSLDESDIIKEINTSHRKRKVGSIRKRYYAMLKRIRHDLFKSSDVEFLPESNGDDAFHSEDPEPFVFNNTPSNLPLDMDGVDIPSVGKEAVIDANAAIASEPEVSHVQVQVSSTPTLNNKALELNEGKVFCPLNGEDPEIPSNDDIFLLIHPDALCTSTMRSITKSAVNVSNKERNIEQGLNSVKKCKGGTSKDLGPRHKAVPDPTQFEPTAVEKLDKGVKKGVDNPIISREVPLNAEIGLVEISPPKPVSNSSTSDQERPESENDDPNFSDIEAMILDMDLGQYDDDLHFTRRVSKYQQGNAKRKIMRLEQRARVSIQKAMTSRGALAVLYGRHSRHFIRKTEVLLGRSTEENVVDIDLGKEGCNNRISRRQAIVKMEHDGSFTLKNLAKNPILVNGAEVGNGESIGLSSSCLIEIRGIGFVFETNKKHVERCLENARNKNQGQMANFEWLPNEA